MKLYGLFLLFLCLSVIPVTAQDVVQDLEKNTPRWAEYVSPLSGHLLASLREIAALSCNAAQNTAEFTYFAAWDRCAKL